MNIQCSIFVAVVEGGGGVGGSTQEWVNLIQIDSLFFQKQVQWSPPHVKMSNFGAEMDKLV